MNIFEETSHLNQVFGRWLAERGHRSLGQLLPRWLQALRSVARRTGSVHVFVASHSPRMCWMCSGTKRNMCVPGPSSRGALFGSLGR